MPALLQLLLAALSGATVGWGVEKFAPGKVPQYEPVGFGFNLKTLFLVLFFLIGSLVVWFLGKKFKLFKTR